MACFFFFCIPAHGHVNPTLPLVRELTRRGHRVVYYETEEFRGRIEAAGAQFISVEPYMPPAPDDLAKKVGKDFASLIEMVADTTIALDGRVAEDIKSFHPDCVIADSVCFWGRLLAKKHNLPFICSTTTFAFNRHTAKLMRKGPAEILRMIAGMPRIEKKMAMLRAHGHDVSDFTAVIGNDETTDTIVYTSRGFQPMQETFGNNYAFVGPCVQTVYPRREPKRPLVYISLGTVLHDAPAFYRRCIAALGDTACDVVISIGDRVDPAQLSPLPGNIRVYPRVNQLEVLSSCSVFLTHCGMNSASESLLCGVPMVLYPQHSEEKAVADRVKALGAGLPLRGTSPRAIRKAVFSVLENEHYRLSARRMQGDFSACCGAAGAADFAQARLSGE